MTDPAQGRWRALLFLSLAELGALSLWFSAAAVLPALSREWHLGDGGRAGLTIAVQAGFILGTLGSALGNLPDILSPRILMLWSAVAGAALNGALALWVESLTPALVLRFATGLCMAGAYPPAMKIVWSRRAIRHLVSVRDFIAEDSEQNAAIVAKRILDAVELLQTQPEMGRPGRVLGTRELVVPSTPYIIPYRVRRERIELIAVFHGRQKWPTKL